MKVIAGNRRTGRTTELIKLCGEAHNRGEVSYIVCHAQNQVKNIMNRAKEMGYNNFPMPITYYQAKELYGQTAHLFVDNVEFLINNLFAPNAIEAVTITTDDET